jgi:hypothetical protein
MTPVLAPVMQVGASAFMKYSVDFAQSINAQKTLHKTDAIKSIVVRVITWMGGGKYYVSKKSDSLCRS